MRRFSLLFSHESVSRPHAPLRLLPIARTPAASSASHSAMPPSSTVMLMASFA